MSTYDEVLSVSSGVVDGVVVTAADDVVIAGPTV